MSVGGVVVGIAIFTVAAILGAGLYTMWKGGEVSRNWSNRLMRFRVLAQFVAILIILVVLYITGKH